MSGATVMTDCAAPSRVMGWREAMPRCGRWGGAPSVSRKGGWRFLGLVGGCLETADDGGFGLFVFLGGHFAFLVELSEVGEGEGGAGGGGVVGGHPLPVDGEGSEHGDHGDDEDGGPEDDAAGGSFGGLGEEGGRWWHWGMVAGGGWGVEGERF